jgi:peptidyl-prolyl cis-trans isomerase B (cyclophilin B)
MVGRAWAQENPVVVLETTKGEIVLEFYQEKAPVTVKNFLEYVESDFYDGTLFHRVIDGFMIQGGGLTEDFERKPTGEPIRNEADNGLNNERGTIAMARTGDPHSATSQFFINVVDNEYLNFRDKSPQGWGYAVFGKVIEGMDVVDAIAKSKTTVKRGMRDVPVEPIIIEEARVKNR